MLCNTGSKTDLYHTGIIRQHYVFLVDNLVVKHSGLVAELYSAGVLSREELDVISSEVMSFIQNEKLLSMLSRKSNDQFDKFLDALDKTGQQHIRNYITGRQGQLVCAIVYSFCLSNTTPGNKSVINRCPSIVSENHFRTSVVNCFLEFVPLDHNMRSRCSSIS